MKVEPEDWKKRIEKSIFLTLQDTYFPWCGWMATFDWSSHWKCSVKKGIFKNFANFTGKHLCWSFFLIMVPRVCNFIKKRLQRKYFRVKVPNFLEHLFWRTSGNSCFCFESTIIYAFMPLCFAFIPFNVFENQKT